MVRLNIKRLDFYNEPIKINIFIVNLEFLSLTLGILIRLNKIKLEDDITKTFEVNGLKYL